MKSTERQICNLIDKEDWAAARKLIRQELRKKPDDHWLLDRLSLTYYEEQDYARALQIIEKARQRFPDCPMILWDYAGTLDAVGRSREAIKVYEGLRQRGVEGLTKDSCGEGKKWARALIADCVYRIGLCYKHLQNLVTARDYLLTHLSLRDQKYGSVYKRDDVRKKLRQVLDEISTQKVRVQQC